MDSQQRTPAVAWLATFASGAAALVFELVWLRLLALAMGATAPALAWVLSAFFTGLLLGAAVGGRLALAPAEAKRAYICCELAIAVLGIGAGFAFSAATASAGPWIPWLPVLLLPPAFGMGLTLPLLVSCTGVGARGSSILYAVNTIGGAAGVAAAGFFALENLGLRGTLGLAGAANLLAAVLAALIPTRGDATIATKEAQEPSRKESLAKRKESSAAPSSGTQESISPAAALFVAFAAGAISISGEVVLTRLLYQVLGGTAYAVAATLCVYLAAIAVGAAASAATPLFSRAGRATLGIAFLLLCAATAASGNILAALADWMRRSAAAQEIDLWTGFGKSALVAIVVLLPPSLASGFVFPLLIRARGGPAARALGGVYAANTLGAVAGSLATTFLLVPTIGTTQTLLWLGAAGSLVAAIAARSKTTIVATAAALAAIAFAWKHRAEPSEFRLWLYDSLTGTQENAEPKSGRETPIICVEGSSATAAVYERAREGREPARDFAINGKKEASTDFEAQRNQLVLGHLPMLLHPEPKRALVVGLGAGVTAGAVSVHPGVETTVAELSPEVPNATKEFAAANHRVLERKNVSLVFADGRRFLVNHAAAVAAGRAAGFDVITSDPIHPWVSGAANLYTVEYYHWVGAALAPRGVAAHWLPLYEMRVEESLSIYHSFASAFRHCALWITYAGDAVLLGSNEPLRVDIQQFAERAAAGDVGRDLKNVRLDDPLRFLAGLAVAPAAAANAEPVTDDKQILEFRAARNIYRESTVGPNLSHFADRFWSCDELLRFLGATSDAAKPRLAALLESNRATMRAIAATMARDPVAADLAIEAWIAEPDGEQLAPFLLAPGLAARLSKPATASEALVAGAMRARQARRSAANPADEIRISAAILRAGFTLPGLDPRVDRALRRQTAVLLGELRDYQGVLDILRPLLAAPEPDPAILRIASRALAKLGRESEAATLATEARAKDFRQ